MARASSSREPQARHARHRREAARVLDPVVDPARVGLLGDVREVRRDVLVRRRARAATSPAANAWQPGSRRSSMSCLPRATSAAFAGSMPLGAGMRRRATLRLLRRRLQQIRRDLRRLLAREHEVRHRVLRPELVRVRDPAHQPRRIDLGADAAQDTGAVLRQLLVALDQVAAVAAELLEELLARARSGRRASSCCTSAWHLMQLRLHLVAA